MMVSRPNIILAPEEAANSQFLKNPWFACSTKESKKRIKELEKKINETAYEDGQNIACFEISKKGDKVSSKRLY